MALLAFREIMTSGDDDFNVKGYVRNYKRVFRAEVDNLQYSSVTIITLVEALGLLPHLFSPWRYPDGSLDFGARLLKYHAAREHDLPLCWLLTCDYSSNLDDLFRKNTAEMARDAAGNNQTYEDPFAQPPTIEWGAESYQRVHWQSAVVAKGTNIVFTSVNADGTGSALATPDGWTPTAADIGMGVMLYLPALGNLAAKWNGPAIVLDVQAGQWLLSYAPKLQGTIILANNATWTLGGDPLVNSAWTRFDPSPEWDDSRLMLTIGRNELVVDPTVLMQYKDAVNSDPFWGAQPGQAKLKPIKARGAFSNGLFYFATTYEIHFRAEGFSQRPLDQGSRAYYPNATAGLPDVLKDIPDPVNGTAVSGSVPLDGRGKVAVSPAQGGGPFYRKFYGYNLQPFAALMLPFNIPQH
jgi:hypothetical protein